MTVYVALLRAVNVTGTALQMTELKVICEGLGLADVKTYIQSGNVLFRSDDGEEAVAAKLDEALARRFGKKPGVMVRTTDELGAIVENIPFPDAKPNFLLVHFLPETAPAGALEDLVAPDGEEAVVRGREIWVHYPNGSGRSKLRLKAIKPATSRNLNTVRKLAELAREMAVA